MKRTILIAITCLLIGGFFGYLIGVREQGALNSVVQSVATNAVSGQLSAISSPASIMLDYGDGRVRVYPDLTIETGETALSLLEKTAKTATLNFTTKSFSGLGLLVESVGDKVNGTDGKYWQYWVNNRALPVGAGEYKVKPGDIIEWKFINYH